MTTQAIKRGIIQSFNNSTYTASVLLLEATSATLDGVPIANHIDGTSGLVGAYCAVLFFDENNYTDAVVIACYQNGSNGLPTIPPGRVTFITGVQQFNAVLITSGTLQTFTMSGIPAGALGVVYKAYFQSPTVGASIEIAPHNGSITAYQSVGNIQVSNQFANGGGLVQVDASGKIDIKALNGDCTTTMYVHGYVI